MHQYDIGIIGSGPAGYVCAIKAALNGLSVVLFEKDNFGGTCLNSGCVPTKATIFCADLYKKLLKCDKYGILADNVGFDYSKIIQRRDDIVSKKNKSLELLLKSHEVDIVKGNAQIPDNKTIICNDEVFSIKNIVIATGTKAFIPSSLQDNNSKIYSSETLLKIDSIPENIVIIGSGAIGTEWCRIFSSLKKQVHLIELAPQILPMADLDVSLRLERILKKDRVKIYKGISVQKIQDNVCYLSDGNKIETDMTVVAIGRKPDTAFDVNNILDKTEKGFIKTDSNFKTNFDNVFAIGDINGISQLAHSASKQASLLIDYIVDRKDINFNKCVIPSVIYGTPEIAWIGKREQDISDVDYKVSNVPVSVLAKAYTDDEIDGFIKVLTIKNKIAGVHIISKEASSLLPVFQYAVENEIAYEELENLTYAHPTYSEIISDVILNIDNKAINLMKN